jgi:hypothetical protein
MHFPHFCTQIASAYILVFLGRLQHRLHTNYTFSFHLACSAIAIGNIPMPAMQLNRKIIMIFYRDAISEHVFSRHRVGIIRLIKSLHAYLNAFRNFRYHQLDFT